MNNQAVMFSITDVVSTLWRRKLIIILVTLLGAALMTAVAYQMSPVFVAQGQVVVRSAGSIGPDPDHSFYSAVVSDAVISTERDVMGSLGLATQIADGLDIPQPPEPIWRRNLRHLLSFAVPKLGLPATWASFLDTAPETEDGKIAQVQRSLSTVAEKGSSVI
ncbi:MAG: hypothetical protein EON55_02160, partial [Alphaproteobacteria bacterium]